MSPILRKLKQLPSIILILGLVILSIVLYWPALNGRPIWDDWHFLFGFYPVIRDFSLWKIWTEFNWPLSVVIHKGLYSLFRETFWAYHFINLTLHLLNTLLIFKLAQRLKISSAKWVTILFLIHPACVLSVGWMIQLKTLMCFFFCGLSFIILLKNIKAPKNKILSCFFFLLSLLSKSASLPLLPIFIHLLIKDANKRIKILTVLIGTIVISVIVFRFLNSPVTQMGQAQLASKTFVGITDGSMPISSLPVTHSLENKPSFLPLLKMRLDYFVSTTSYYFWQVVLPLNTLPIKGSHLPDDTILSWLSMVFMGILLYLTKKTAAFYGLAMGLLLLLPFSGLLPAPFMNMSWVSDQHLYLALPFFMTFWIQVWDRWKFPFKQYLLVLIFFLFGIKTFSTASYLKDDVTFYSESLKSDYMNLPVVYNLIRAHLDEGQIKEAINLSNEYMMIAANDPKIATNKYFPKLYELHQELKKLHKP